MGLPADGLETLILTHFHFDHLGGFFMLLQGWSMAGRTAPLDVHLPEWGIPPIRQLLDASLHWDLKSPFEINWHPLVAGESFGVGTMSITPFATSHQAHWLEKETGKPDGAFETFGLVMEVDEKRLVHSADLGGVEDLSHVLELPADLLVCEMAHVTVEDLVSLGNSARLGHLAAVHLPPDLWERKEAIGEQLGRSLPEVYVSIPEAGDELVLE